MAAKMPTMATGTATSGMSARPPVLEEHQNHNGGQRRRLQQGPLRVGDRLADERRGVVGDLQQATPFGKSALSSSILARILSATSSALVPGEVARTTGQPDGRVSVERVKSEAVVLGRPARVRPTSRSRTMPVVGRGPARESPVVWDEMPAPPGSTCGARRAGRLHPIGAGLCLASPPGASRAERSSSNASALPSSVPDGGIHGDPRPGLIEPAFAAGCSVVIGRRDTRLARLLSTAHRVANRPIRDQVDSRSRI